MATTLTMNGQRVDRLPDGVAQPVTLDPELQKKLVEYIDNNANNPDYLKFIDGDTAKRGDVEPIDDKNLSPARRIFLELDEEENDGSEFPEVTTIVVGRHSYSIRRLSFPGITKIGMLSNRRSNRTIAQCLLDEDYMASLNAAMLHVAVVTSETDMTPMFTMADGWEWALSTKPSRIRTVKKLSDAILEFNPRILTGGDDYPDEPTDGEDPREKKDGSAPAASETSSPQPPTTPPTGGSATASTDGPQP